MLALDTARSTWDREEGQRESRNPAEKSLQVLMQNKNMLHALDVSRLSTERLLFVLIMFSVSDSEKKTVHATPRVDHVVVPGCVAPTILPFSRRSPLGYGRARWWWYTTLLRVFYKRTHSDLTAVEYKHVFSVKDIEHK